MSELVPLGEVCDFVYGANLPDLIRQQGEVPVYGSNGRVGWHNAALTKGQTIIIGRKGSVGQIHFSQVPCFPIDTTYYIQNPKSGCDLKWLYYGLIAIDLTGLNKAAAVPGLNRDDAYEKLIPLPSLEEQQRIAATLERADHLRRTRRFARQMSDTFLQSVFLKMFGDPVANPMDWETFAIEELGKVTTGATPPSASSGMFGGSIPFVTPGDLDSGVEVQRTVSESGAKKSRVVRSGSTLVCCIGATIGKTNTIKTRSAFNQQINAIEWDDTQMCDEFGLWMMRFMSVTVADRGRSTTLPILNKSNFESLPVFRPPIEKQREFAAVVQRFERLRAGQIEAERQANHLFQTLLHQAFSD